jgi:hypothetical protein
MHCSLRSRTRKRVRSDTGHTARTLRSHELAAAATPSPHLLRSPPPFRAYPTSPTPRAQAARKAVEEADALGRAQRALADALAPAGEIDIPDAHAFLVERLAEFNASLPYCGFSQAFLDAANRPGRFDREARRKAFATLEAIFCLLPEPKKARCESALLRRK